MKIDLRSESFRRDPYPTYRYLREHVPVFWIESLKCWTVARYSDVQATLQDPKTFLSSFEAETPRSDLEILLLSRSLVGMDPPKHAAYRSLISRAFIPATTQVLEPAIRSLVKRLLSNLLQRETFDFIADFAAPLPIEVISKLLGVDPSMSELFKRWSDVLITWRNGDLDKSERRQFSEDTEAIAQYFNEVISQRRSHPAADLISGLLQAGGAGKPLNTQEILEFVRFLLVAGHETTTSLLGNALLAFLSFPEQGSIVKRDPSLIPQAIEEVLRFDSPAQSLSRRASVDTKISGIEIKKGDPILVLLASANHDETLFSSPERFDVRRDAKRHLAFGHGIHFCLGAPLARLQARIAFEEIFLAFEELERIEEEICRYHSLFFRGPKRLEVRAKTA